MAALKFDDLLTKISYVFKTDCYLVDHRFIVGGAESEAVNAAHFICDLSEESIALTKENLPDVPILYIENVKKYKAERHDEIYLKTNLSSFLKKYAERRKNELIDQISKFGGKEWNEFPFTSDLIAANDFFKQGKSYTMFEDDTEKASVTIGKSLFPMATEKNCNDLKYQYVPPKKGEEIHRLFYRFPTDYFILYGIIQYVEL